MGRLVKAIARDEPLLLVGLISTDAVERAREIHDTYPTASAALGRVISGALLLSALIKEGQRVILQVLGDGPLGEVLAEADWLKRTRGYIRRPHIHLGLREGKLDVGRAIGKGVLTVTKDLGLRDYYQGSVPLQIATDLAYYLKTSEQVPAAVSLGVYVEADNTVGAAGGFLVHALPEMREELTGYLEYKLLSARPVSEMVLDAAGPEDILSEAVGLPFDVMESSDVQYRCPCTKERVLDAIAALGEAEVRDMLSKGESVSVQCEFCKHDYSVGGGELESLLEAMKGGG
jgi:molecular chaperone Hsp33